MTEYKTLNVKLSYSQHDKLKPGIKNNTNKKLQNSHQMFLVILIMKMVFLKNSFA